MNSGSRLWIISEEMSINMLTRPRSHTPAGICRQLLGAGLVIVAFMSPVRPAALVSSAAAGWRGAFREPPSLRVVEPPDRFLAVTESDGLLAEERIARGLRRLSPDPHR
ncbi:hypothetical protein, partial [Accumulibacter sp.]|uniref:hypothetical protein n=1 Tax=Accumulibacter sp. TaxID=2053492 RepID=UPI00261DB53A